MMKALSLLSKAFRSDGNEKMRFRAFVRKKTSVFSFGKLRKSICSFHISQISTHTIVCDFACVNKF